MEMHPKSEAEDKSSPNWLDLPQEVTVSILQKLDVVDILEIVQRVCTQWESICKEPFLCRTIIFRNDFNPYLNSMFRQAVDRSCGGLIDLRFRNSGTDQLLNYATQRCTNIRSLQLVRCWVSDVGLSEAAKRLPLLEDLEISYCVSVTAKAVHKFGECCPLLKSFKMRALSVCETRGDDSEAISIAENMVELRHLQLLGNQLTNKGLKSILDNCSHLESLDLRRCYNLDLERCALGKRCKERIKDFHRPDDYTDDAIFDATVYDMTLALMEQKSGKTPATNGSSNRAPRKSLSSSVPPLPSVINGCLSGSGTPPARRQLFVGTDPATNGSSNRAPRKSLSGFGTPLAVSNQETAASRKLFDGTVINGSSERRSLPDLEITQAALTLMQMKHPICPDSAGDADLLEVAEALLLLNPDAAGK